MSLVLCFWTIAWIQISCLCPRDNPEVSRVCFLEGRNIHALVVYSGAILLRILSRSSKSVCALKGLHRRAMSISLLGELPRFSGKVTAAPLQLREPRPSYLGHAIPRPTARPYRSPRVKKEAPTCSGSSPHLCLITLVPAGPAGESAERNPVHEPEGNAGGKSPGFVSLVFVHLWLGQFSKGSAFQWPVGGSPQQAWVVVVSWVL